MRAKYVTVLNRSMILTYCFAHLGALSFEIAFD